MIKKLQYLLLQFNYFRVVLMLCELHNFANMQVENIRVYTNAKGNSNINVTIVGYLLRGMCGS